jgi:gentisate 1,2-dioxygenase
LRKSGEAKDTLSPYMCSTLPPTQDSSPYIKYNSSPKNKNHKQNSTRRGNKIALAKKQKLSKTNKQPPSPIFFYKFESTTKKL